MRMQDRPFENLLREHGYESVAKFAEDCGLHPQSIFNQIRGQHRPSIDRMFIFAKTLKMPFGDVFEFFYGEDLEKLNVYLAGQGVNVL